MTTTTESSKPSPIWSAKQQAIFNWFATGENHLIVRARAGTGKSTTIRQAVTRAPERAIWIAAFSKEIQLAMAREMNLMATEQGIDVSHITTKTIHAVGFACVRLFRHNIKVEFNSTRADKLTDTVCGKSAPDTIKRLVSKLHTKGREIAPHATKIGDLTTIAITFECEPSQDWANAGFGLDYVEARALEAMELASNTQNGETIDGSDMIFLPVRNGWMIPQFDLVVVDEAQDMTPAQLEIARGVLRPGGRIAIVGDNRQAIFAFRGADATALDRLKAELQATELGLNITYRCGKTIVAAAQTLVPDFEAGPNNPEGSVEELHTSKLVATAGPGDFILSRINAPLVSTAMQLLRSGKRARVAGRDIGAGLKALIRKLRGKSVPDLLGKIESWAANETRRIDAQIAKVTNGRKAALQAKREAVLDQADMLVSLTDGAKNVMEVETRIDSLFTDDGLGQLGVITCSSVHRAKGLEANRVFVLRNTIRYTTEEEQNIAYVAITRAKQTLVWVDDNVKA